MHQTKFFFLHIVNFFENFLGNCKDTMRKRRKELKMKFDVQIKTNKRLYEDTNIANHFKAASNIVRDSSKKLGELCLSQARTHHIMEQKVVQTPQMFRLVTIFFMDLKKQLG